MKTALTESQVGLLQICLNIGRDRFQEYTTTLASRTAIEQFERQAKGAEALVMLLAGADAVTIEADQAAA